MLKSDKGQIEVNCENAEQLFAELATLVVTVAQYLSEEAEEPVDVSMCNLLDICWEALAMEEETGGKENG